MTSKKDPKSRAQQAAYRAAHKDKRRAYDAARDQKVAAERVRKWRIDHPEHKDKARALFATRSRDPEGWAKFACRNARERAKKKGLEFDLCPEDIHIPAACPFTLLPFDFGTKGGKPHPQSPSVDRIKPDRGYIRGNVRVISFQANVAKSNITDTNIFQRLADDARLWSLV